MLEGMDFSLIFTALTGGAFLGVLGTLGVSLLNQRHEKYKWVRDQRRDLYLEIIEANTRFTDDFYNLMVSVVEVSIPEEERDFDVEKSRLLLKRSDSRIQGNFLRLRDFQTKVTILSSKRTSESFREYCDKSSNAINTVRMREPGQPFNTSVGERETSWAEWERNAKRDLGIKD